MKQKIFPFSCCVSGCKSRRAIRATSATYAVAKLHADGWASTSMASPSAQHICDECLPKHAEYEPGRPFKRSIFADMISARGGIK